MANLCGVNEKMLSEALKNVDEDRRNRKLVRETECCIYEPVVRVSKIEALLALDFLSKVCLS